MKIERSLQGSGGRFYSQAAAAAAAAAAGGGVGGGVYSRKSRGIRSTRNTRNTDPGRGRGRRQGRGGAVGVTQPAKTNLTSLAPIQLPVNLFIYPLLILFFHQKYLLFFHRSSIIVSPHHACHLYGFLSQTVCFRKLYALLQLSLCCTYFLLYAQRTRSRPQKWETSKCLSELWHQQPSLPSTSSTQYVCRC